MMPIDKKSKVALVGCRTYDPEMVFRAVGTGLGLLGGVSSFVREEEKILVKPNVLMGMSPEKCVCTHPSVFRAVVSILKQAKVRLSYGDSSGFGGSEANMRKAGLKKVADELGIVLADFSRGQEISYDKALLNRKFYLAEGVLEADGVVSLPKLKTHGLTRITGGVKNQFGCVPGFRKSQFHVKMADPLDFATMLVDLNTLVRPRLYVMDAVMAMEGNGPRGGRPKNLGVLLFSNDPVAMDAVACKIVDLNPEYLPTSRPGEKAGLGTYHLDNIEVIGDNIESFIDRYFDVVRKPVMSVPVGRVRKFVRNRTCPKPVIDKTLCTNCGTCVAHCPVRPRAVNWETGAEDSPPVYKYERCIRCFCCQELCPDGAISVCEPVLGKIFNL